MVFPKPEETAVLIVNGAEFRDWETVMVKHEMNVHPWIHFRFTCSEGMPLSKNLNKLQIVPGMQCQVILAGLSAVDGYISTRQVFVDARRHHIEIQGVSDTAGLASAAAITKTGEFNDTDYATYAKALIKPFPGMKFIEKGGSIPAIKFPRISIPPGSTVLDALEIPLRSLGHVQLTSNVTGDLVAQSGPSGGPDTVYEGELGRPSYIEAREIFFNSGIAKGLNHLGQKPGTDDEWGAKVSHIPFLSNSVASFAGGYAQQVMPNEIPAWSQQFLKGRSNMEENLQGEDEITVIVVVNGWLRPSGGLWEHGQEVVVISPILVLDEDSGGENGFEAKSVTFEQDDKMGTRTTLELCNAAALAGTIPQEGGK